MAKVTVQYSFDMHEERDEFISVVHATEARRVLEEIDHELRQKLKHCDDNWLEDFKAVEFLECLRNMICISGVLYDG